MYKAGFLGSTSSGTRFLGPWRARISAPNQLVFSLRLQYTIRNGGHFVSSTAESMSPFMECLEEPPCVLPLTYPPHKPTRQDAAKAPGTASVHVALNRACTLVRRAEEARETIVQLELEAIRREEARVAHILAEEARLAREAEERRLAEEKATTVRAKLEAELAEAARKREEARLEAKRRAAWEASAPDRERWRLQQEQLEERKREIRVSKANLIADVDSAMSLLMDTRRDATLGEVDERLHKVFMEQDELIVTL
jgi:hypothetical protein